MNKSWKTWSPFQSRELREICAHLTDDELDMFVERSRDFGRMIAKRIAIPIGITVAGAYMIIADYGGSIAFALVPCAVILVSLALFPWQQKRQKELLCSTAWAKEQGIDPDRLKVFSFRFRRK
ncbi:MAG: hypothetical protein IH944_13030 [Armatimonadetes bacterium]|nr:hypothetical protein [Armatimonadota bacterium]